MKFNGYGSAANQVFFLDFHESLAYNTGDNMNSINSPAPVDKAFWHSLFDAGSIAVIGANDIIGSWGFYTLKTAMASKRKAYAVNPNIPQILGLTTYKSILDIPGPIDLAIIVVPAGIVSNIMRQCGQKKVGAAVIISAGFAEVDEVGARLQSELLEIANLGHIRFVGPNCLGHYNAHNFVSSTGAGSISQAGPLAVISQSGTLGASIVLNAASHRIGISKFVSTGNEASVHLEDFLEYLARDSDTLIISAYIEGLREGRRFFNLAREISFYKPILVIKTGTTEHSSKAAKSHTGALAGSDVIYSAAFKQSGVIRADNEEELCDVAAALLNQPLLRGDRIGILTMGGGFGVVTAEACEKEGLKIAALSAATLAKLNGVLPPRWSHGNPVDMAGIKHMGEDQTVMTCFKILMEDENTDAIISLLPPVTPLGLNGELSSDQLRSMQFENQNRMNLLAEQVRKAGKPLFLLKRFIPQQTGAASAASGSGSIPEYSNTHRIARVLHHLVSYRQYLESNNG
jgi:acetate---CoA ligase (ADP-forming)